MTKGSRLWTTWCSLNILGSHKFDLTIIIIDYTLGKIYHNVQRVFIPPSLSEPPVSLIPSPISTCWPPPLVVTEIPHPSITLADKDQLVWSYKSFISSL